MGTIEPKWKGLESVENGSLQSRIKWNRIRVDICIRWESSNGLESIKY